MTMNWTVFAVCMFAIVASYLVFSIPLASAAQVTVSYGGSSQTTTYSPDAYITRHVSVDGATGDARVQVSNGSSNTIDSVYVYKCQSRDPSACSSQVTPVSLGGNVDVTYAWNDVSDAAHQTANIMLVVHTIDAAGGRWLSFWSSGTKIPGSPATYAMTDSSISSIAIMAKDIGYVSSIRSFIDAKGMLPMNPLWISSIVFSGATNFYDLETSNPPAADTQTYYTGNSITNLTGSYAFIFPYNGVYTLNGITVASSSSSYIIGDGTCSAGEPSDLLGCIDCGSDPGYYCDVIKGQKQLNSISLSTSTGAIRVSNCNVPNTISLGFTITNMPSGMTTPPSAQYSLNGSAAQASVCSQSGNSNIFTCSITTPIVPGCSGTDYAWRGNSMAFSINFPDGRSSRITKTLSVSFPDITVGSWTPGNNICEDSLGENQANSCHDCGCPANQYCDFATAHPETSACKNPITDSSIELVSVSPPSFYTHNPVAGDTASIGLYITNSPQSLSVTSSGCRVTECFNSTSPSTGLPCAASCTASCTQQASSNPNLYNESCAMNFRIAGYDPLQNYTLYTAINNTLSYNNGTSNGNVNQISSVLETVSQNKPVIHVGAHFQGDGICDPDENSTSVCYDCPCPSGQFCDSLNRAQFTPTDACSQLSSISIALGSTGLTSLTDSSIQHGIPVSAHVEGKPHGVSASGTCSFNNSIGAPACTMPCTTNETAAGYDISCSIGVPAIDYKTSPFYDSTSRMITLPSNSFSIAYSFNNGSRVANVTLQSALPNITISVVPHCGLYGCETDLGETPANCCLDCVCNAGSFCYGGVTNGQCLGSDAIALFINRTNPPSLNCTIAYYKGKCQSVQPVDIYADIANVPLGAMLTAASYQIDNQSYDINCFASPIGQNAKYICSTALPEIAGEDGGNVNKPLRLQFTIRYSNNGTVMTKNITANASIGINRIKSQRVMDCEKAIKDAKSAKSKIGSKNSVLMGFLAVAGVIAATAGTLMAICCFPANPTCAFGLTCPLWVLIFGLALMLVGCIGGMLNSALEKAKAAAQQAEDKKVQMCASSDPASMKAAAQGAKGAGSGGLGTALGIICAIGIVVAIIGAWMMASAAAPAAPAGLPEGGLELGSMSMYEAATPTAMTVVGEVGTPVAIYGPTGALVNTVAIPAAAPGSGLAAGMGSFSGTLPVGFSIGVAPAAPLGTITLMPVAAAAPAALGSSSGILTAALIGSSVAGGIVPAMTSGGGGNSANNNANPAPASQPNTGSTLSNPVYNVPRSEQNPTSVA